MSQEVTVRITVGPEGAAAVSTSGASSGGAQAAAPMELQQLQAQGTGQTPAPVTLSELARLASSGAAATEGGGPPPPIAIEQLQTSGVAGAPAPTDVGSPGATTGAVGAGEIPRPMSPEELEALGGGGGEREGGGGGGAGGSRPGRPRRNPEG